MKSIGIALLVLAASLPAFAGEVTGLTPFTPGTPARAGEVNANFDAVAAAVNDNHTRLTAAEAAIDGKQDRVDGTCAAGTAMSGVEADGDVTCVPLVADGAVSVTYSGFVAATHTGCSPVYAGGSALYYTGTVPASDCYSMAPVALPHGAALQSLSCRVLDSSSAASLSVLLLRHRLVVGLPGSEPADPVFETLASVDAGNQTLADDSPDHPDVDNTAYAYELLMNFHNATPDPFSSIGPNLRIVACTVAYTAP